MCQNQLISIIIPTYNRASVISRTIDSFLCQDYSNWELLVVDDFSSDNTQEVIKSYNLRDKRIKYLLNERSKGAQGARNTGILHAKYDWVILFDSDDFAYPDYLSSLVSGIDIGTDIVTCYARVVSLSNSDSHIAEWGGEGYIERKLMRGEVYVNFISGMIKKCRLYEIGLLDENCPCFQELDTHLRLSETSCYKQIKRVLLDYSWGGVDTISYDNEKNLKGYCYVMWHNKKRWRKLEYFSFIDFAAKRFRRVDWDAKKLLLCIAPELLFRLPVLYLYSLNRKVKCMLTRMC